MSAFLASVRSLEEAQIAFKYADIIDLKEPSNGALGALPLATMKDIVHFVDGRTLVSATVGDLPTQAEDLVRLVEVTAATGVDIVKLGFLEIDTACINALRTLTKRGLKLVAVLFVDVEFGFNSISLLGQAGFYGVMLDTAHKQGRSLCDCVSFEQIEAFLAQGRECGLFTGLAGALSTEQIELLSELNPDYLGFRGALCGQNHRQAHLELNRVEQCKKLLYKYHVQKPVISALSA